MDNDYIVGKNAVIEALKSERDVNKILIAEGSQKGQMQTVIGLAKNSNVLVQFVPKKKLDTLVDANHQGLWLRLPLTNMLKWMICSHLLKSEMKHHFLCCWMRLKIRII